MADQDPVFQIQRVYLKEASLEQPNSPAILLEQEQPSVDIQLGVEANPVAEGVYEVAVTATVHTKIKDKTVFLVSSATLEVNADLSAKLVGAVQCAVTNVKYEKNQLSFDRADECLPMPVDERAMPALKLAPLLDDLNRYELKVAGLKEGRYDILIDGQAATSVTHLELATGWNMAVSAGPITRQACDVLALIFKKNLVGQALWEAQIHGRKAKLPGLQTQRDELEAQINATCQPKPHHFVIQPVGPS